MENSSSSVVCLHCSCVCYLKSWKAEGLEPLECLGNMFVLQRGSQKSGWPFAFLIWNVCLGWRSHPSLWLESPSSLCSWRAATAEFWLQRFQASWGPAGDESQTSCGAQMGSGWLRKDRNVWMISSIIFISLPFSHSFLFEPVLVKIMLSAYPALERQRPFFSSTD